MPKSHHYRGIIFAAAVASIAVAMWWLVQGESSPFHSYFLYNVGLSNFLAALNLPSYLVGILASGNAHQPSEVVCFIAMFVQWFIIGWLVFRVASWLRSRRSRYAS